MHGTALIFDRRRNRIVLAVITHFGFRHFRFTVSEAIAERIQHAARKVAVRAVFHRVIRKRGQLVGVVIKRHGQLAAEGILAEQKLSNRLAAACTRIPALHYSGEAFLRKAQIHGAAGHIDENDGLAGLRDNLHQFSLRRGQQQIRLVAGADRIALVHLLALKIFIEARHQHHNIAVLRHGLGFGKAVAGQAQPLHAVFVEVATLGVQHAHVVAYIVLDALQHRDIS